MAFWNIFLICFSIWLGLKPFLLKMKYTFWGWAMQEVFLYCFTALALGLLHYLKLLFWAEQIWVKMYYCLGSSKCQNSFSKALMYVVLGPEAIAASLLVYCVQETTSTAINTIKGLVQQLSVPTIGNRWLACQELVTGRIQPLFRKLVAHASLQCSSFKRSQDNQWP